MKRLTANQRLKLAHEWLHSDICEELEMKALHNKATETEKAAGVLISGLYKLVHCHFYDPAGENGCKNKHDDWEDCNIKSFEALEK